MGNRYADNISIRQTEQQYNFESQTYGKITLKYTLKKEGVNPFTRLEQVADMDCVSLSWCYQYVRLHNGIGGINIK
jgi:hypothetical protein